MLSKIVTYTWFDQNIPKLLYNFWKHSLKLLLLCIFFYLLNCLKTTVFQQLFNFENNRFKVPSQVNMGRYITFFVKCCINRREKENLALEQTTKTRLKQKILDLETILITNVLNIGSSVCAFKVTP